jgi:hypothetical protein
MCPCHYELHTDTGRKLHILLKTYIKIYGWVNAIYAEIGSIGVLTTATDMACVYSMSIKCLYVNIAFCVEQISPSREFCILIIHCRNRPMLRGLHVY